MNGKKDEYNIKEEEEYKEFSFLEMDQLFDFLNYKNYEEDELLKSETKFAPNLTEEIEED